MLTATERRTAEWAGRLVFICFWCAVLYGMIVGIKALEDARCHWRWDDSNYGVKFTSGAGCMVNTGSGVGWVPESNIVVSK